MRILILFAVVCDWYTCGSSTENTHNSDSMLQQKDTLPKTRLQKDSLYAVKDTAPTLTNIFNFFDSIFAISGLYQMPYQRWKSSCKKHSRNATSGASSLADALSFVIVDGRIQEQQLDWVESKVAVYKGKVDFKFAIFSFQTTQKARNGFTKPKSFSRYILRAKSRIKQPNYFCIEDRYLIYFQTRASMFSSDVLRRKNKLQIKIKKNNNF